MDPEAARRLLEENRLKPIQSFHHADEKGRLKAGETVDITDTFTINTFKHPTHALYKVIHEMRIDAATRSLSFAVHRANITGDTVLSRSLIIGLEQDLYDALQALLDEAWLRPYREFFDKISVTCFRVRLDGFDLPQHCPFMRVEIPVAELQLREGKFYNVADLPSIATITMLE